jgi:hypothetical protein
LPLLAKLQQSGDGVSILLRPALNAILTQNVVEGFVVSSVAAIGHDRF